MGLQLVAFDLFGTLLDLDSLCDSVKEYTAMPQALVDAWRQRQLQLANAATSTGRYVDFDRITLVALHEVAPRFHVKLKPQDQKRLVDAWAALRPFPDVEKALAAIVKRRIPMALLTNAVESTARNALIHAKLDGYFQSVLSADTVKLFKPHANVYNQLLNLGVADAESVLFVSANDWDAMGARQAGFHTVWVNRRKGTLLPRADRTIADMTELPAILDEYLA